MTTRLLPLLLCLLSTVAAAAQTYDVVLTAAGSWTPSPVSTRSAMSGVTGDRILRISAQPLAGKRSLTPMDWCWRPALLICINTRRTRRAAAQGLRRP